ncbi:hypothetical protein [Streptomyces sp. NPDC005970]|uniref:hypothetical protein n=1 Tax=Streptomyces sp. NPDC005970 TaxID=3156723 RepID=UPI0033ED52CA
MNDLDRARIHDALTRATAHGGLNLDGDTIAAICDVLTAEQPHEQGHTAPHEPHSPSKTPEGPATQDRAADGRTAVHCLAHPTAPVIGGMCGGCTIYPADMTAPRPPMDPVHILGVGAPAADPDAFDSPAVEPHPAAAERDQAYRERAALLAWISALHPANAVITPAEDVADEDGWLLLYLLVGGWQMAWHIHPRDADLFDHVEHATPDDPRAEWDGHTTEAKYDRLQLHVQRLTADRP